MLYNKKYFLQKFPTTCTTNFHTDPNAITTIAIKTNMRHIHTFIVSIHLPQETITQYCAHLHHTLVALKRLFPTSLFALLPNAEQINHPSSNHINYTKSTQNHIHQHYAPFITLTYTTHIISSTAPTYHCHPWICGQTPPE